MARRSARRKHPHNRVTREKFSLGQLLTKRHRPLHIAGLGTLVVFLQGIFAIIGVLLIISAALAYALRALKSNR